jgi:hypothetical protein
LELPLLHLLVDFAALLAGVPFDLGGDRCLGAGLVYGIGWYWWPFFAAHCFWAIFACTFLTGLDDLEQV